MNTIPFLLESNFELCKEIVAVICEDRHITYSHLWELSGKIARYLRQHWKVQNGSLIGVLMDRSELMIASMLGIMRAGCGYVPLDASYPHERLEYMVKDSSISGMITESEHMLGIDYYDGDFLVIDLEMRGKNSWTLIEADTNIEIIDEDIAYVIYTSGSTGNPKGVAVEQRHICNTLKGRKRYYGSGVNSVHIQIHSLSFDTSIEEIFVPLISGGKVVVPSEVEHGNFNTIIGLMLRHQVNHLLIVPSLYNTFLELPDAEMKCLLTAVTAGESLSRKLAEKHFSKLPGVKLVNAYGPSECSICSSDWEVKPDAVVKIGRPTDGVKIYVLNDNREIAPPGEIMDIYIGGLGVARGYLNNPELTHDYFMEDPFVEGGRMYRTGDLGRWNLEGELEFIGRKDTQVKIRGYRVELGEIEEHLRSHPSVREAVVLYKTLSEENKQLIGYYQSVDGKPVEVLQEFLGTRLPDYMVPVHYMRVEQFALTANGKLDRKNLPAFEIETRHEIEAPSTEEEALLVRLYGEILGIKAVSVSDNFFDLGGDSIKAIQLSSRLYNAGYRLEVRDIFEYPRIKDQALLLKPVNEVISEQGRVEGEVLLTAIQKRFFEQPGANRDHFNQSVVLHRASGFDIAILNEALKKLQRHHDALRMTYEYAAGGEVRQYNRGEVMTYAQVEEHDLRGDASWQETLERISNREQGSLSLEAGDLLRAVLFRLPEGDRLLLIIHHIVVDGISWRILFEDFRRLYNQELGGSEWLPRKTESFRRWSEHVKEYSWSLGLRKQLDYWQKIESHYRPGLVPDNEGGSNKFKDKASCFVGLTASRTEDLVRRTPHTYRTNVEDLLLSALGISLAGQAGGSGQYVMVEGHGREDLNGGLDVSRTVGWFTSLYPVWIETKGMKDLSSYIKRVKEMLRGIPGRGVGYGMLRYEGARGKLHCDGEVLFNYLGQFDSDLDQGTELFSVSNDHMGDTEDPERDQGYKLRVTAIIVRGGLEVELSYSKQQFNASRIAALGELFKEALHTLIDHCLSQQPELTLSDLTYQKISIEDLEGLGL